MSGPYPDRYALAEAYHKHDLDDLAAACGLQSRAKINTWFKVGIPLMRRQKFQSFTGQDQRVVQDRHSSHSPAEVPEFHGPHVVSRRFCGGAGMNAEELALIKRHERRVWQMRSEGLGFPEICVRLKSMTSIGGISFRHIRSIDALLADGWALPFAVEEVTGIENFESVR